VSAEVPDPRVESRSAGAHIPVSPCSRCGRLGRMYFFPHSPAPGSADLCGECRSEWDRLMPELAARWHAGLRACFFCRRPLGDERFPARSPLGASCADCGLALGALIPEA